ncbi:phosphomannose isomerase/mannose-1-phosphate guanylyl transferase [Sulfurimicrobium lacus]|uniref:mannose-1-phosphate guanylyltransferase n=1 Tax=Sulfurimicrobium lacus TaxID=2715678 RepID=A0A6F8VJ32_9PROT|nr:phosphomannose isomerase/mannose-1-phosphate guanylyl transferase [Sulfurimicrobium lacus]
MLIPVILSGGAGTRLWPVSREAHPKPFMKLADGQSLLQKTFLRAAGLPGVREILTITNREYYFKSKDEYEATEVQTAARPTFLLEPVGRNTAPAIALGAMKIAAEHGPDALMLVLSADHLIDNLDSFSSAVDAACLSAKGGTLATFGIVPTGPETGFGYIECGDEVEPSSPVRRVSRFVEKPTQDVAREYLATGRYLWNSGMFCFKAGVILQELAVHAPLLHQAALACWEATQERSGPKDGMTDIDSATFAHVPDISIDYAIMERSDNVVVVPGDFSWSDIGSWGAVSDLVRPDEAGNRVVGEAILVDTENTYIQSENRLVAAVGLEHLIIVDTPDALLVANRDRVQDVKKVVEQLKLQAHESYKLHRTVSRPWGTYTVLEDGPRFKIKRIVVKPGAALSLQMHHHRSEHWVVVSGMARVVNGGQEIFVNTNESTFIPAGHKHRLENPGILDLVMIEVQSGEYLGEDDIVRFEDVYGRVAAAVQENN